MLALRDAVSRSAVDDFWAIWCKSAEEGLFRAYSKAGGPTEAGNSAFLGRGLLRIRSRRLGGRAVGSRAVDGVGDCHDVANLPRVCLFISFFLYLFWVINLTLFFQGMVFHFSLPLDVPVARREPTPCYNDAYSVGTLNSAFCGKGWRKHCKTMISPFRARFSW